MPEMLIELDRSWENLTEKRCIRFLTNTNASKAKQMSNVKSRQKLQKGYGTIFKIFALKV